MTSLAEHRQEWALAGALLLAAGLRLWGLLVGAPVWHADEFNYVYWPLLFFVGDLNPDFHYYPHLHYYFLALLYALYFLLEGLVRGFSLQEAVALHYFWETEPVLFLARLTSAAFGVGAVGWAFLLGRRAHGPAAGLAAALLLAVSTLHVRQSPLAAADLPMTFWFLGALWASLRLLERGDARAYLLAGALVGLAAASKYHGALAGAGVLAAHLVARRSLRHWGPWLAGLVAGILFALTSPYVLLDWQTFLRDFGAVLEHVHEGREQLGAAWWYHLRVSLRYSLGWAGLALLLGAALLAARTRQRALGVLLVAFAVCWAAVGAGKLVFLRYALPLAALQAVLAGIALGHALRHWRWGWLLVPLALVEPLYGSLRVAALQGREDTRQQARAWIEAHVPARTALGNFGGWAGDVQVETFEHLWWRTRYFAGSAGYEYLEALLPFLEREARLSPTYHYAIQHGNSEHMRGSMAALRDFSCGYAILHRHPLDYSQIDSAFAAELAGEGALLARFAPEGLEHPAPAYDPLDAYYLPVGHFGALRQPGPKVEIWALPARPPPQRVWTATRLLAGAYMSGARSALDLDEVRQFLFLSDRALRLDPEQADAAYHNNAGLAWRKLGDVHQAMEHWRQSARLHPDQIHAWYNMGLAYRYDLEDMERALECWLRAAASGSQHAPVWAQLGEAYWSLGRRQEAEESFVRLLELDPEHPQAEQIRAFFKMDQGVAGRARRPLR